MPMADHGQDADSGVGLLAEACGLKLEHSSLAHLRPLPRIRTLC